MGYRTNNYGRGQALEFDKTTTGATCIGSLPNSTEYGRQIVRVGDKTTPCPKCGKVGVIVDGEPRVTWYGRASAVDCSLVLCGCPPGTNRIMAPLGQWLGRGKSPEQEASERRAERKAAEQVAEAAALLASAVFAKSCLRGNGCTDAGTEQEPLNNFGPMGFYWATPQSDPATNTDTPQRAQAAKKKNSQIIPEQKKTKPRGAIYRFFFGMEKERDQHIAAMAAASAARVQTATQGASILRPLASGAFRTAGTWAIRVAGVAAGGVGAPVAAFFVGMMPGKLNEGEQDFIDKMRLEQMTEAKTRVRFTWEYDKYGDPVPRGWHTPQNNNDLVRVRKMVYDGDRQAYTFTTEDDNPITIIWTPDASEDNNRPWNTGNQTPPQLPGTIIVDPQPEATGIDRTTSPAPAETSFRDYILILPVPNMPPIYVYISKGRSPYINEEGLLRNGDKAVIQEGKISGYALNPDHPYGGNKAKVFESSLGFKQEHSQELQRQIRDGIARYQAELGDATQYGQNVYVDMPVSGIGGKVATIRTGWFFDNDSEVPRLGTVYVKK